MSPKGRSQLYCNLAKYVRSGMGIDRACESLLAQPGVPESERQIYLSIQNGVHGGQTIAASLAPHVSGLEASIVEASEKGGQLDAGFDHLGDYFDRVHHTRSRIKKSLIYPVVVFHLAIIICGGLSAMTNRFFLEYGEEKSWGLALWESLGWVIICYALFLLMIFGAWLLIHAARKRPSLDLWLFRVPLLGPTRKYTALERFTRVFEIFLLSGTKMSEALTGAGHASGSAAVQNAAKMETASLLQGNYLAPSLFNHPKVFPNDFCRGIAAGEESGQLDAEFKQWSQFYAESAKQAMDKIAEWAPKLLYWLVLLAVAILIIRVGVSYRDLLLRLSNFSF
ncbi:MAG: type II secretion system F family protein [Verrucomicrobiota bacterium]